MTEKLSLSLPLKSISKAISKSVAKSAMAGEKIAKSRQGVISKVGILGLGIMGSAMAKNLILAGFEVCGFDPSTQARKALRAVGGKPCANAIAVAEQAQVIICSLPSGAALLANAQAIATQTIATQTIATQTIATQAIANQARPGLIMVETSTLDIAHKERARILLAKAGVVLLDCPLSGTGAQAVNRDLTVYVSGPKAASKLLKPVFEGFSKEHFHLGAFGNGMRMKLMANLLVAIHNVSTAEALLLGKRWGIPVKEAVKVLSGGAGGSRMLQVRGPQMENQGWERATMKIDVWQKDMGLIADALRETGVPAPLFSATVPIYNAAAAMGHGMHDTAAVFNVLDQMSRPVKAQGRPTKLPSKA